MLWYFVRKVPAAAVPGFIFLRSLSVAFVAASLSSGDIDLGNLIEPLK